MKKKPHVNRLSIVWLWIGGGVIVVAVVYVTYLANFLDKGYCFAQSKYLTDDEKIRLALVNLLRKYPPAVIKTPVTQIGWGLSVPKNPIYYRDVDEFLVFNPDCCKVNPAGKYTEGAGVTLIEQLTGTATGIVEVNYLVHYLDETNTAQSVKYVDYLHITNCGKPGQTWSPY